MAHLYEQRDIIVTISPKELRDLADTMERDFTKKKLGDSCFIDVIGYGDGFRVLLHADQEWFHKSK